MHKKMGAVFLVAGTCLGSGMIALPLVLAKIGLVPSIALMLVIWFIMYYTSLLNIELHLQAGKGLTLGSLGRLFSGKTAEFIGVLSLKLLSYALLAVFLYGGSSIMQELLASKMGIQTSLTSIASWFALSSITLLLLPIQWIDYVNRILFTGLLAVVALLLAGLAFSVNWSKLPLFGEHLGEISVWAAIIPVVFTSFGFQTIFHSIVNYGNMQPKLLKHAVLWGSLIPAIVYVLWTSSILSVVFHNNPEFYSQMMSGHAEIGELIQVLGGIAQWEAVQMLVWWISILAIVTSVLGVGVGLCDSIEGMLVKPVPHVITRNFIAAVLTIVPAFIVVMMVPNAFIAVLGFAGMILAIIAILLPVYLFWQMKAKKLHYDELKHNWMIHLSTAFGLAVILFELYNMA